MGGVGGLLEGVCEVLSGEGFEAEGEGVFEGLGDGEDGDYAGGGVGFGALFCS